MLARPRHFPLLALLLIFAGWPAPPCAAQASGPARLELSRPYVEDGRLRVDFDLADMYDQDTVDALEAGLPATLVFRWKVYRTRSSWWDNEIAQGGEALRVFYDLLDERFDLFDDHGLHVSTCEDLQELEDASCRDRSIATIESAQLKTGKRYYIELEASVLLLDEEEVRGLEGWLRGELEDENDDAFEGVSKHAVGLLKDVIGMGEKTVTERSSVYER